MNTRNKLLLSGAAATTVAAMFAVPVAQAVCPVCTVAVGAGLGFARWLGVDDTVTGVWIGALLASTAAWTVNYIAKKRPAWRFPGDFWAWLAAYAALTFLPLQRSGIVGHPLNTLWGMDKVVLGSLLGTVAFVLAAQSYEAMKRRNGGHAHFPFEKVALPVAILTVLSGTFYVITKR